MLGGRFPNPKRPSNKTSAMILGGFLFCTVLLPVLPAFFGGIVLPLVLLWLSVKVTIWFWK